ncbi:uncharacterized protein TRIVIDRAFT_66752 [Trichoderma virens Gv29-8]|uniref:Uncharacterized protein n=1 Tax=Hypocrea virens (strain Gv29-8 / FGSC 10586) TaxID=413071 RepID=G9N329_HYPVG|nr:uncharacterized protein TRIVIDRAFT_66752 [Trichoderma virens Gv29-8]EHK18714.1 hypothetical protein TRIVIDRAFT_66752 [Trichoderma virens Gv29-8]UKZ56493.1 hypothetical protein TrVGV298_010330 [Trichoderma virens]UKZ82230.1 hypothetical protein TrVFT333_010015 [Trichoderma virens FT-333]
MAPQRRNSLTEDIYRFLQELEENKIRSTATGSSEFTPLRVRPETPRRASISSQDARRLPETDVLSITSGETPRSSIFDPIESSSSISSVLPGQRLPCEFYWYDDCEQTFDLRDIDGWVDHVATHHLHMMLPNKCCCWFCDEIVFRARPNNPQQHWLCYTERMHHIAGHYRRGATINDVRPDFYFLHHLWVNRLITRESFQRAKNFHEAPQPKHGIHSVPEAPSANREAVVWVQSGPPRGSSRRRHEPRTGYYR